MNEEPADEILRCENLELRPREFLVRAHGRVLKLTRQEQQLLAVMLRHEGRVLSREELYALAWGRKLKPGDRTVDVYVGRLRARLGDAMPESALIHTHFGFGYRFSPEPSSRAQRPALAG